LFPIEMMTGMLRGWVGWISGPLGGGGRGGKYTGPLKYITKPLLGAIAKVDKSKLKKYAEGVKVVNGTAKVPSGSLMKGGLFSSKGAFGGMSDFTAGFVLFLLALILICAMLILLVKFLRYLVGAAAKNTIRKAFGQGALVNIFLGVLITVSVQSSSITTSTLVPLAATALISLEEMFPIVLGANIGTTCTALLAALAVDKVQGLELALVHLSFNLLGILMLYPYEPIREIPLSAARGLGNEVELRTWVAPAYLMVVFVLVPGLCLALAAAGAVALIIGSFFIFGTIFGLIFMRYLFLNPEITMLGMDHKTVRSIFQIEAESKVEMPGITTTSEGPTDTYYPEVEQNTNYRPAKFN